MEIGNVNYWLNINSEQEAKDKVITGNWNQTTKKHLEILKKLDIKPDDTVLDYGCGVGRLMKNLNCKKIGADISDKMLSYAMKDVKDANFISLSNETGGGLPINFADKIYSLIVLQHMTKPKAVRTLIKLNNCLKQGGSMLIQFPNLNKLGEMYSAYIMTKYTLGNLEPTMEFYTKTELEYIFKLLGMIFCIEEVGTDYIVTAFKQKNIIPLDYMVRGDEW